MAGSQESAGVQALRTGVKAFEDRDRDTLMGIYAEDIVWHGPLQGTLQGREELWERFFAPLWDAPLRLEVHDILDNGEHLVALEQVIFDVPDGPRSWKVVEVMHYDQARQVTERWAFVEHEQEFVEFVQQLRAQAG